MTRTHKLAAAAVLALALAGSVTACGEEAPAPSAESSDVTAAVTPPSDRSVPVVPGRKPTSQTATPKSSTPDGVKECGAAKGPDGALEIHLVAGDVTCATAQAVAKDYSPLIATGKPQKVKDWDCAPSTVVGELARCTNGSMAFAFVP